MEQSISLSTIVPIYNEEQNLEESVNRLIKEPIFNKIVLVDDASEDSSLEIAKNIERNYSSSYCIKHLSKLLGYIF